jgi:hypothetical protein
MITMFTVGVCLIHYSDYNTIYRVIYHTHPDTAVMQRYIEKTNTYDEDAQMFVPFIYNKAFKNIKCPKIKENI